MKIVHAADLHLDSPMRGLEYYAGAPVERLRGATRVAMQRLVDLCLEEKASLLLLAGDLFDGPWRDYSTGLFFLSELGRLRDAGTRVVSVRGNHDAASQVTRHLRLPEHVTELGAKRPESRLFESLGVAVHGQSFPRRDTTDDLASRYPPAVEGMLNVGLLHTALTGRAGHEPYAPCRLETLVDKGYDYWALGHVHQHEVVCDSPWVVFPGNLQGRHVKEAGPKGVVLLSVDDACVTRVEHQALDVVRWAHCMVEGTSGDTPDDVLQRIVGLLSEQLREAGDRLLAARITVAGVCGAHAALQREPEHWEGEIRALANDLAAEQLWIEQVRFETLPVVDVALLAARDDAIGQVVRNLRALKSNPQQLVQLKAEFAGLASKLPAELCQGDDPVRLDDPEYFRGVLDDVERMLLPRLGRLVD